MPNQVDSMRGLTSGFLAGVVGGVVIALFTIVFLLVLGLAVPSQLLMQLVDIVAYVAWPIGGSSLWGCLLGMFYASTHRDPSAKSSVKRGWIYGILFSLPQFEMGLVILLSATAEVGLLYLVSVILLSVFLFGTLLVVFWRKKLYFHGYWGMK